MIKQTKLSIKTNTPYELIERQIYQIRGRNVMIDSELASLYGVDTKYLKRAVKRNLDRFPSDFMFELTVSERKALRCQFGTSKRGGGQYAPYVFTEQGIAMLSSVLHSKRAIQVNIIIVRTFVRVRELILSHKSLQMKIETLEKKYDAQFHFVFEAIKNLIEPPKTSKKIRIGF